MGIMTQAATSLPSVAEEAFEEIDQQIGQKLRQFRVRINKTQSDIAKVLDISPQQYQKYEKGTTKCSIVSLLKLASFYQCAPTDLLPGHSMASSGLQENGDGVADIDMTDDAKIVSAMLAMLIRIQDKEKRRKVVTMLSEIM